jgi:SET domain-containing protein
LSIKF